MKTKKRLIIIDSNSLIHRAYHALPPLTTRKGELVNAVYGFFLVFLKILRELKPDFMAATFDLPGPTFRHKEFKEYKAKRPPTPKELYQQIPKIKKVLEAFNVPIFEKQGFEADDLIGTIAGLAPEFETIILSGDLDVLQLVSPQAKAFILRKGIKDIILYDVDKVKEEYQGLNPSQLLDFKALRGDPSDNIPGVTGIGKKTAIKLIKEFGSLENLYSALNSVNQRVRTLLEQYKEQAFLSRKLCQIRKDVPIDFDLQKCQFKGYAKEKVVEAFKELEFHTLVNRLSQQGSLAI